MSSSEKKKAQRYRMLEKYGEDIYHKIRALESQIYRYKNDIIKVNELKKELEKLKG